MLAETVGAEVYLVHGAVNYRRVAMANITAAPAAAPRVSGFCSSGGSSVSLGSAELQNHSRRSDHGTQRHTTGAQREQAVVSMFAESCGEHNDSEQHCHGSHSDQQIASTG